MFPRLRNLLGRHSSLPSTLEVPDKSDFIRLVRWRKRRWAPIRPSKMYYVRKPTPEDPEEKEELLEKYRIYNTQMRSLRQFIKEAVAKSEAEIHEARYLSAKKREFDKVLQMNNEWNEETRKLREARVAAEAKAQEEILMAELERIEAQKQERAEKARQMVKKQQELVAGFIDMSNLDQEIERALNTRVSYNWAVDKDGKRYIEGPDGSIEIKDPSESSGKTTASVS